MSQHKFQEAIDQFVNALSTEHLRIQPTAIEYNDEIAHFTFDVRIVIEDKYINSPIDIGFANALNNKFYTDADVKGVQLFGEAPSWNNTKHTGWFIIQHPNEIA